MKKLPKIYQNEMNYNISNNKEYTYAHYNTLKKEKISTNDTDVNYFLDTLFNSEGFIFNKPVVIKTNKKTIETAIVKRDSLKIYTLTDEIINIDDILSIKRK